MKTNPLRMRQMPLLFAAVIAAGFSIAACGFFTEDDPTTTGDPCVDFTLQNSWPIDAAQVTHFPGAVFTIKVALGGMSADGIGTVLDGEVVFQGQSSGPSERVTLSAPMAPGSYPLRVQRADCAAQGNDFTITVAHPPALTQASVVPSGPGVAAIAVVWRDDHHYIAQFSTPTATLALIDADTQGVITAVACPDCDSQASLAISPDGRWLSNGAGLYELRGDTFFHWTTFSNAGLAYSGPFFLDSKTLTLAARPNKGTGIIVAINLDTGQESLLFTDVAGGIRQRAHGLVLIGSSLYRLSTGALTGHFGVPTALGRVAIWQPSRNIAVMTGVNSHIGAIMQVFPSQVLTRFDEQCELPVGPARWIHDPLGEIAIGFGNKGIAGCAFDADGRRWAAKSSGWSAGISDAAWSPDGQNLVFAGTQGVQVKSRESWLSTD